MKKTEFGGQNFETKTLFYLNYFLVEYLETVGGLVDKSCYQPELNVLVGADIADGVLGVGLE